MNNGKQTDVTDDRKSLIDVIFHAQQKEMMMEIH